MSDPAVSRRHFLLTTATAAGAAGAASLPLDALAATLAPHASQAPQAPQPAKYTRYNVMSAGGQKALASYQRAIDAMLKLPPTDPRNWFRNAFIHMMDCPHGNWWFYVWHRGYLGYFEQTLRTLSGDPTFAIPYWDWTTLPQIPDGMFNGVLTPTDPHYEPYTRNISAFSTQLRGPLTAYWNSLNAAQRAQLDKRNYKAFDDMWNDVMGLDVPSQQFFSGNLTYAFTSGSRYLTRDNPKLDPKTAYDVSPHIVSSGLLPKLFYSTEPANSFTSSKTASHNDAPNAGTKFSVLEGLPHNKTHNFIGGVGPCDPGPYGNMTNNLSPVDPIFFLHHSNMDRLWDVWVRKQKALGLPYLPTGADLATLSNEPFLFYADSTGKYVGTAHAGDYLSMDRFNYQYEPGFGENVVQPAKVLAASPGAVVHATATPTGNAATVSLPTSAVQSHINSPAESTLVAEVTIPKPTSASSREFDVLVGAPASTTQANADSPYYAGTIAFFGHMAMTNMGGDVTFTVPLPKAPTLLGAAPGQTTAVNIRVVPSHAGQKAPTLKSVVIRSR
ncbi:MAG TPA: tyrosinase family protein [Gemmatimonadaceae bacterium]|nr:tyrosinase family protein [Gemmatimonadaceae bacterium]